LPIHFLDIFFGGNSLRCARASGACSDLDIFRECLDLLAIFGLLAISFSWIRKNLKTLELGRFPRGFGLGHFWTWPFRFGIRKNLKSFKNPQ